MGGDTKKRVNYGTAMTPEERIAREFRAKCRFRAAVRFVMSNLYWISDIEDEELGDDVKKNVMLLIRKNKSKKDGLLNLGDKAILNTPVEYRTEEEKARLYKVIGGLKCFRRYASHVKRQLAAVTYFVYYGPGRTIVRQGDEAHSLYFLINGYIAISKLHWDPALNIMVDKKINEMGPGSLFGDITLLHNIPRMATATTITHCEFLRLKKDDFNVVLKETILEQWNEMRRAMRIFRYFDDWNEMLIRECCLIAKLRSYKPEETILGDGRGLKDSVYFILKGRCRMVEHIYVVTEYVKSYKHYKLYVPPQHNSSGDAISEKKNSSNTIADEDNSKVTKNDSKPAVITKSFTTVKRDSLPGTTVKEKKSDVVVESLQRSSTKSAMNIKRAQPGSARASKCLIERSSKCQISKKSPKSSRVTIDYSETSSRSSNSTSFRRNSKLALDKREFSYTNIITSAKPSETHNLNATPEVVFMQICIFNATACFGIGENFTNRRIIAMDNVDCFLIPRYWLVQKNKGNVWNRVKHILNHIPSTEQIFKEYVLHKKWLEHRKRMFDHIYEQSNINNDNNHSNIPYSIRLNEDINFP